MADRQAHNLSPAQQEFIGLFMDLFSGRTDRISTGTRMSTRVNAEDISGYWLPRHLSGRERIGFYNMLPDSTVNWLLVEFESHGTRSVTKPGELSVAFLHMLNQAGIWAYREVSKSGPGNYHVWVFFEEPAPAEKSRRLALAVLGQMGLADWAGAAVEVFPARDRAQRLGHFVWLPFFGGSDRHGKGTREGCTLFIDDNSRPAKPLEFLASVKKNPISALDEALSFYGAQDAAGCGQHAASGDRYPEGAGTVSVPLVETEEELLRPLVENCPRVRELIDEQRARGRDEKLPLQKRGISWEEWHALVGLLCHFGDVGSRLIHRLSALSSKYDAAATSKAIEHWRSRGIPPSTCSLLACTRKCFSSPSPVRWVYRAKQACRAEHRGGR